MFSIESISYHNFIFNSNVIEENLQNISTKQ